MAMKKQHPISICLSLSNLLYPLWQSLQIHELHLRSKKISIWVHNDRNEHKICNRYFNGFVMWTTCRLMHKSKKQWKRVRQFVHGRSIRKTLELHKEEFHLPVMTLKNHNFQNSPVWSKSSRLQILTPDPNLLESLPCSVRLA